MTPLKLLLLGTCMSACTLAVYAQTEPTPKYYRYFSVEISAPTDLEVNTIQEKFSERASIFSTHYCAQKAAILIAVDVSYARRIDDIEQEILELVKTQIPAGRLAKPSQISKTEKSTFCE